ncbi:MAG: hypothetical protein F6K10_02810, partial [Moorea sp. SIO2B7]|nr:hypothetical protein [Moorena sp. SIO2B7]
MKFIYKSAFVSVFLGLCFFPSFLKVSVAHQRYLPNVFVSNNKGVSLKKTSQIPISPEVAQACDEQTSGPVGGGGGYFFRDEIPSGAKVTSLQIRAADRVDSIQVFLNTGPLSKHGGDGGYFHRIRFEDGEYIRAITGRSASRLDQISIHTEQVREFVPKWAA